MNGKIEPLPVELNHFILKQIHSVEQLEVLLLLFRRPNDVFTVNEIDQQIRTNVNSITMRLHDLESRGLVLGISVEDEKKWRYSGTEEAKKIVPVLARYYASHQTRIVELIYSRPPEAIGSFARAFRLR